MLALMLTACPDTDVDLPPVPPRGGPAPILPGPSASAATGVSSWVERLPPVDPSAQKGLNEGDRVWAATPIGETEMVDVAIYTVSGIYDGLYALSGRTGQRIDSLHPALVHPATSITRLVSNSIVLFYTPSTPAFLGRVSEVVGGEAIQIRYDQGGVTATTEADHVELPVTGIKPMAYVGFPKASATSRGLVIALTSKQAWVRTASGHVEVHDRARVKALPLPPNQLVVGDEVLAFRWATGYQPGAITEIKEDGLRYVVTRDEKRKATYFFSSLLPKK